MHIFIPLGEFSSNVAGVVCEDKIIFQVFFSPFFWAYFSVLMYTHSRKQTYISKIRSLQSYFFLAAKFPSISLFSCEIKYRRTARCAIYSSDSQMADVDSGSEKGTQPKSITPVMELPRWNPGHRHLGNQMLFHNGEWFQQLNTHWK